MRGYIVKSSVKIDIKIDEDELPKVLEGIRRPIPVMIQLRQGMIRSDLIAGIIFDNDRLPADKFDPQTGRKVAGELTPLKNIFENLKLLS